MRWKYVMFRGHDGKLYPVVFPEGLHHVSVARGIKRCGGDRGSFDHAV